MKTKMILTALLGMLFTSSFAQDKTIVNAMSSEISDNLDLRAVASIFGDSQNLDDFEKRLNNPKAQISNLDLNGDNQVDYLRVVESVENNVHLVVVQAVLDRDKYQDVATVEVQKDNSNQVHVQVVGNAYIYGKNYIYEPVYVSVPVIYNWFWTPYYRPYCSTWYWGYYPSYYYAWNPCPVFRYRNHIGVCINYSNHYNYVNYRRCETAYARYYNRRGNHYEVKYPGKSFEHRNNGYQNRYDFDQARPKHYVANNYSGNNTPGNNAPLNPRNVNYSIPRSTETNNATTYTNTPRGYNSSGNQSHSYSTNTNPREKMNNNPRSYNFSPRSNEIASTSPRNQGNFGGNRDGSNGGNRDSNNHSSFSEGRSRNSGENHRR